jgi:hypothetical protein
MKLRVGEKIAAAPEDFVVRMSDDNSGPRARIRTTLFER